MARKKKIKLDKNQKKWLNNLEWYLKNKVCWTGKQNLKDAVLDGKYAAVSARNLNPNMFDSIVCSPDMSTAECVMKHNYDSICQIVNLETLEVIKELKRIWKPDFSNWREKNG